MDFRFFRMSVLKCPKHLKRVSISQQATSGSTAGCFFYYVDHFSKFQVGHPEHPKINNVDIFLTFQFGYPENPNIHEFDHFSTFPIGHPEIPKIHDFDHFSYSRIMLHEHEHHSSFSHKIYFPDLTVVNW